MRPKTIKYWFPRARKFSAARSSSYPNSGGISQSDLHALPGAPGHGAGLGRWPDRDRRPRRRRYADLRHGASKRRRHRRLGRRQPDPVRFGRALHHRAPDPQDPRQRGHLPLRFRQHRRLAVDDLRRQALGAAGQRQQPGLGERASDHRRLAHARPRLGRAGGAAVRRRPAHQHHRRDRHRQLATLPVRLSVHRCRGARRGLRAVLRRLRRCLGRRHGRPLERQSPRHAVAGDGRGVCGVGRRERIRLGSAAGGHDRRGS